jgi:hypothetical protein
MGKRAYVVTFKQIDPLFALDLSNPSSPQVLGQLKIPGYSSYLHPISETMLIGFGKDAGANQYGNTVAKGLKLSLFDVADVANLKELDTYLMGDMGSDSIALTDHKAFLYSGSKNIISIPVTLREAKGQDSWGDFVFGGAMVFKIENNKFVLQGKIDHSDGGQNAASDFWDGYGYYDNTVKRSLYIGDSLFTLSNRWLKANSLSDLKEITAVELSKPETGIRITPLVK